MSRSSELSDGVGIEVRYAPADPPADTDRPVLTHDWQPFYGDCWTLWYVDELGGPQQAHTPGTLTDVGPALRAAADLLAPIEHLRRERAAAVRNILMARPR